MILRAAALVCALIFGAAVCAEPPDTSPRPLPRQAAAVPTPGPKATISTSALRPQRKPMAQPVAAQPAKPGKPGARGYVCGDPAIQGTGLKPIPAKIRGCGLSDGVTVTAVSGVPLSQPVTVDCTTAKALKTWVDKGIRPAIGKTGGGLARLEIAASYACRPRNNQKGAKVSEHGRGRAIDLAGVRLANGQVISVLAGWRQAPKIVKALHRSACGPFGTVLGPNADRFHKDHIHVDTARYRGGNYCK